MKIQPNPSDGQSSPLRLDLTKKVREAIQNRQPLPPPVEEGGQANDARDAAAALRDAAAAVKQARDTHRDQFKQRVSNQRAVYTKNHAGEGAEEVAKARADYDAKLETRKANTGKGAGAGKGPGSDSIEISAQSQKLVDDLVARSNAVDQKRDERVRELRDRYVEGKLDTKAMVDKAAQKMLEHP